VPEVIRDIPYFGTQSYRYRRKLAETLVPLCSWLARRGWSRATALLLACLMIRAQRAAVGTGASKTIVVLPKAGINEDVAASLGGDAAFEVLTLDRTLIKGVFSAFLAQISDDNSYLLNVKRDAPGKAALRAFWAETLKRLLAYRRIDAFVTGNFSYHAEQEMAAAAASLGLPFVALHKECRKTPRLADFYVWVYQTRKGPFQGSHVLTYNHIEADIQARAEVAPREINQVTGMARMDAVHRRRRSEAANWLPALPGHRPTILFFSVFEEYGLPFIRRKVEGQQFDDALPDEYSALNWSSLMTSLHHALVELGRGHPDLDVIIKTKGDPDSAQSLRRMFGEVLKLPANVRLVSGGDPLDLIFAADVVCGFNTTALVEAIAADAAVVVPKFAGAIDPEMAGYVMDFGGAVVGAESLEQMTKSLVSLARRGRPEPTAELNDEQRRILDHWVGNADGRAGERVRDAVARIVGLAS